MLSRAQASITCELLSKSIVKPYRIRACQSRQQLVYSVDVEKIRKGLYISLIHNLDVKKYLQKRGSQS